MLKKTEGKRVSKYKGAESENLSRISSLVPLNDNQGLYIKALKESRQIIVLGPSGTGKTFVAATFAANLYLQKAIDKIIITRPAVSVGKTLGSLPGDIGEKYGPWLSPVISVLEEVLGKGVVETGIKNGNIILAPLEYMRGSSFNNAFVLADECFTPDTEVLTDRGFVRFDNLGGADTIAQYNNGKHEFVIPSRFVEKEYSGEMTTWKTKRFSMTATNGHSAVYKDPKGNLVKQSFQEKPKTHWSIPTTSNKHPLVSDDPLVALTCALQADGSFLKTKTSAGNYTCYWTITLKRQNKIERLEWALKETKTKYNKYEEDKQGRVRYYIPKPDTQYFEDLHSKTFDLQAILADNKEAEFLEECLKWDGSIKGSKVYCSTNKANIDTIQTCAHLCGYQANFGVQQDEREIFKKKPKPYYRLNISNLESIKTQNLERETFNYEGFVYCVTVPSGMIYVRQNGKVFITGNCQNLDVSQFKMLVTRMGENCTLVMNGDIKQSDIKEQSGLSKAIHLAKKYNLDAAIIEFTIDDVVRSDLCKQWLVAFYEENM